MQKKNIRITQRIVYFLERQFVRGAHYHLLFVALLIGIISIVGGVLVWPIANESEGLGDTVWWTFLRLTDPGYLGDDEGTWRRIVATVVTLMGYVLFMGSLVAIITSWLNRKIRHLEQGLSPLTANNHIIILGWTNRSIHIAAELFLSVGRMRGFLRRYGAKRLKLVILSDDVSPARLQELKDNRIIGRRAHEIVLRSGVAIDREHLRRVDSVNAAAIIIPSHTRVGQALITPDVETIKVLLSLNSEAILGRRMPLVVAEIQEENKLKAAGRAYSGPLELVAGDTIISRLIAQNIRHAGLSVVYNELLSRQVKNNLYAVDFPEATGKLFGDLRRAFTKAVLIGVVRSEADRFLPMLNLPADFAVRRDDRLVLVARNLAEIILSPDEALANDESRNEIAKAGPLPVDGTAEVTEVLILGWNHHIPALIRELSTYEGEVYKVTFAGLRPIEERVKALSLHAAVTARVHCHHVFGDPVNELELRNMHPARFHHILLASTDKLAEAEEADARTIVGAMLLDELIADAVPRPQVLIELADPDNEVLMRRFQSEVLVGPMIMSHLLAQIALQRELHCIYNELFTVGGAEIIFRLPADYGMKLGSYKFGEIVDHASAFDEIALGIFTPSSALGQRPSLQLNPNRNLQLDLAEDVRLVVLTTVY
jgi:hypothetical protein